MFQVRPRTVKIDLREVTALHTLRNMSLDKKCATAKKKKKKKKKERKTQITNCNNHAFAHPAPAICLTPINKFISFDGSISLGTGSALVKIIWILGELCFHVMCEPAFGSHQDINYVGSFSLRATEL